MRWILILLMMVSLSLEALAGIKAEVKTTVTNSNIEKSEVPEVTTQVVEGSAKTETLGGLKSAEKLKVDNRTESEIPLNLEGNKKTANEGSGAFRIIFTLSILGVLCTGAYILLKKYSIPNDRKHQTQIKVLQQHYLGPKKSLAIIRVAGESILIGVTDHNISMIKSLSLLDDEVPDEAPQNFTNVLFGGSGKKNLSFQESEGPFSELANPTANENETNLNDSGDSFEEFAMKGIKDVVSKRLRGMRSIR